MLHRRGSLPEALVGGVSSQGPCNRDPPIGLAPIGEGAPIALLTCTAPTIWSTLCKLT